MPRRETKPMSRAHFWVFDEDLDRLHKYFDTNIGISRAVRTILNKYLNQLEASAQELSEASHLPEAAAGLTEELAALAEQTQSS